MANDQKNPAAKKKPATDAQKSGAMQKRYLTEMTAAQKSMAKKYAAKPGMLQAIKNGKAPKTLKKIMDAH